jgi:hypothetical protein
MSLDESIITVETGEETLKRLGLTQVISGASVHGATEVLGVNYAASTYKNQARYQATLENPRDAGQGLIYSTTALNNTEV